MRSRRLTASQLTPPIFAIWASNVIGYFDDVGYHIDSYSAAMARPSLFGKPEVFEANMRRYEQAAGMQAMKGMLRLAGFDLSEASKPDGPRPCVPAMAALQHQPAHHAPAHRHGPSVSPR